MKTRKTLGKKMLSILLTAIIVMSTMPMSVFAQESEGGGIYVPPGTPSEGGGGQYIPGEDTRTEIWRDTTLSQSISRGYDGTRDGSTIKVTYPFTDDSGSTIELKEGRDCTAVKTFDSADAGWRTVTVELTLIGEAAEKYKLREDSVTFTIDGLINKVSPDLTLTLSKSECMPEDKILPFLAVSGVKEEAEVTYYYTTYRGSIGSSDLGFLNNKIDESTTLSASGTYYLFAETAETTNYKVGLSNIVTLTVQHEHYVCGSACSHTDHADTLFQLWDGMGEISYSEDGRAYIYLKDYTVNSLTLTDGQQLYLCLNGNSFDSDSETEAAITIGAGGKLTLSNCADTGTISEITADGGELEVFGGNVDTLTLKNEDASVQLYGGTFANIQALSSVNELLADGYAFFNVDDKTPIYFGTKTEISGNYYVDKHDHTFTVNSDGRNECECGLICDHDEIGADGKCTSCKTQIYMALLTKADGSEAPFGSLEDAWTEAIANEGATIRLLNDTELSNGEYLLEAAEGRFTLDLAGHTLKGIAIQSVIKVSGTANIKITNGKIESTFDGKGSALYSTSANAVRIENGGTVTLDGVECTPGSNQTQRGSAVYVLEGNLAASGSVFNGSVIVLRRNGESSVTIASSTFYYGIGYGYIGTEKEYDTIRGICADGNLFFDKDGQYIDITDDNLWASMDAGEYTMFQFLYEGSAAVKPHVHTFADGECSECGYVCPHNGGVDREASYFERAVCSICKAEFGNILPDQEAPTGEININENSWWRSLSDTVSFETFYKEDVKVEIAGTDDSYDKPGFDAAKHAVRIEYLISDTALSEGEVMASAFAEYTGAFHLSKDGQYVIYVRVTDFAGNVSYAATTGFEIDKTPPVIEGVTEDAQNRFCVSKIYKVDEKNIDSVKADGRSVSVKNDGSFTLWASGGNTERTVVVTDKAGNTLTFYVMAFQDHAFDEQNLVCANCGAEAEVSVTVGETTKYFGSIYDAFVRIMSSEDYDNAKITLLCDAVSENSLQISRGVDQTLDLNGFSLTAPVLDIYGSVKKFAILSSAGTADLLTTVQVNSVSAEVTLGEGIGKVDWLKLSDGKIYVYSGEYTKLTTAIGGPMTDPSSELVLYGGSFGQLISDGGIVCGRLLATAHRFEGMTYEQASVTLLDNVKVIVCEHESYDENNGYCPDCGLSFVATITKGESVAYYNDLAEALATAQTEGNKGCTLKLFCDTDEKIMVKTGVFTLEAVNRTINNAVNVGKGAELTITGGTIVKNTICANGGKLTASSVTFKGTINSVGEGSFSNCIFEGNVSGRGLHSLSSCTLKADLNISGTTILTGSSVTGKVTVNNGGKLHIGGKSAFTDMMAKAGGTLEIYGGTVSGTITVEAEGRLIANSCDVEDILAKSGSTFSSYRGRIKNAAIEKDVNITLYAGSSFGNLTVVGKKLIECLSNGLAFQDNDNGQIIDGRVGIAKDVTTVKHTHSCVWITKTHEKLCGCGYVEATDTDAPVISGMEDGRTYYGRVEFSVTDANDFTVTVDGNAVSLEDGKYTIEPDNGSHTVTVTDIAGNTISVTVTVMKLYAVTRPSGTGYTVIGADSTGHGTDYEFEVKIADGYSKTQDYKVFVNGTEIDGVKGDETSDTFLVTSVDGDLDITVQGVADVTPPEAEIVIGENKFDSFRDTAAYSLFFKETKSVTVTASDAGSGIAKVEYLLSETAFADKDAVTGEWTELTLTDGKASFAIEPNRKTYIYLRVTDVSGNVQVINTEGMVVYTDAEKETESAAFTMDTDTAPVYMLKMNGNSVYEVYNGAEKLTSTDYAAFLDGRFLLNNSYLRTLAAGEYTFRLTFCPMYETYVASEGNDAPAEVTLKLVVEKRTPTIILYQEKRDYDGKPLDEDTLRYTVTSDGDFTWEFKPAGADDTAYTTEAPKDAGTYTIRLTLSETNSYKAGSRTTQLEIAPKEVAIKNVSVVSKVYDGTTDAKITSEGMLDGVVGGDKVTIEPGKAAYSDKNVGTDKTVAFSGFSLAGEDAANYVLKAQPNAVTADITVREVKINGASVEVSKVYDGTADAKLTNGGVLSENFDGENLRIEEGTASYDDKNAGTGKNVSFTGFRLAGSAVSNYMLVDQPDSVTADITVKEVTIVGTMVEPSKIYDGTTDAKITDIGTPSVNYDGDDLTIVAGKAVYNNKNVGTGKSVSFTGFALKGEAAANYKLTAQPTNVTADITVKKMEILGTAVESSKTYDGSADVKITSAGAFVGLVDGDDVVIVLGKAAYSDENVGTDKTVTFSGFALAGEDAANYVLAAQPKGTTASITPKELTIGALIVKDKQYDGKNTAEIDGTPVLIGVVDGDVLELVNGTPTFDSVAIGKDIPIHFTAFTLSGDSVTVGNYTLTQPSGITANIVEYVADGSEYDVNSNDWIHTDFVITAHDGYKISLNGMTDGEWTDTLTASDETDNGELIFYVKNTATGVISTAVTENYKIDKTAPTGEVKLNERTAFQKVLNMITFGLFFREEVNVQLTAADEASGVKSVQYYKSDTILMDAEVWAITEWTDNSDFDIKAKDKDKFIIYVRMEDNAGNVAYIGSDGAIFDTTAPKVIGMKNGKTYYVTKKVAIDDENLESVTLNGKAVEEGFALTGDTEATYIIRAVDKAGNVTEYTVYMKPISSITDAISGLTVDHVKSSDSSTISAVERQILGLIDAFDSSESTSDEWNKLTEAAAKCKELNKRIAEVADEITRLTDAVNGYEIDKVTSADQDAAKQGIADIDTLLDCDNLTEAERAALEALKGTALTLLERIAEAKDAAEAEEIKAADGITKDTVKLEDKDVLEKAEKALEDALRDFSGNYTEEEQGNLEAKLETVKAALAAIGNAEKAADEIAKLPNVDDVKLSDKDEVDRVKEIISGMIENEKSMLGKDTLDRVNALAEKIQKLAEEAGKSDTPKTGDTSNPALWSALLIISGGIAVGTVIVSRKKKRSVK